MTTQSTAQSTAKAPGPKGNFLVGSFFEFVKNAPEFVTQLVREYGGISQFRLGVKHVFLVADPELVRNILITDATSYTKGQLAIDVLKRGLGEGLVTSENPLHAQQRKLVQPAFQHKRVKNYGTCIAEHTERMLAQWQGEETRDIDADMHRLTMTIVTESLLGAELSEDDYSVGHAIGRLQKLAMRSILSIIPLPFWVPTPNHLEVRYQRRVLDKMIHKLIADRRRDGIDRGDLLSALLFSDSHEFEQMSNRQLRDEVVTLFSAGHETTANALTWTLLFLSEHPQIQARMQDEIDSILADRQVSSDDIDNLPLTAAVLKESLRLRPTVWLLSARQCSEDTSLGNFTIDNKSLVFISPYAMHRNPEYFDKADSFDPDRWLDGRTDNLHRLAYLPFGAGPRVCIGNQFAIQEALMILASIAQRFHVLPDTIPCDVKLLPLITLAPDRAVRLKIRERQRTHTETRQALPAM